MHDNQFTTVDRPQPDLSPVNAPFWEATGQRKLVTPICDDCGKRHFPPGPFCPHCLSDSLSWKPVSGRGKLVSWVIFHQVYWESIREEVPYLVCTVDLDEGIRLISNLVGSAESAPRYGMPLKVAFRPTRSGTVLPVFEAADEP